MSKKKKVKAPVGPQSTPPQTPIQARPFPHRHFLAAGLMVTLSLIAYSNSFQVPFQFDDYPNIVENPSIFLKNFSASWLHQLIQVNLKDSTRIFAYFTFALNHYLGGLHVFGYHLVNLLIHISSGLLLYSFLMLTLHLPSLRERFGSRAFPIALFSSLLFLCHPIQTQSVTYIVQRMASMAGLLYLLAMVFYVKGRLASGMKRCLFWTGMVLSYLLGLFTKENVAILPLFIGLYEFYFFQRLDLSAEGKKRIAYWLGTVFLIGALAFLVLGKRYIDIIIEGYQIRDFTLSERVLTQFRVVLYYVTLLVWPLPSRLNLDYDFSTSHGLIDPPTTLLAILVVAGLVGYAAWRAKKQPLVSYFILWYFGNLVIESSIFPLEMVYEHRLYLPLIGPVVLFVVFIAGIWEKLRTRLRAGTPHSGVQARITPACRNAALLRAGTDTIGRDTPLWVFFLALTLVFGIGSFQRNKVWANEVMLWEDCVKKSPKKPRAHSNLGYYLIKAKNPEKGLEELKTALRLDPNYGGAHYNIGLFYQESKQPDEALPHLEHFVRLEPKDPRGYNEIGLIHLEKKRIDEAIRFLKKGSELNPYLETIHANLGNAYLQANRLDEAMAEYKRALQLNPKLSEVHVKMAEIYSKKGQRELARDEFVKAVETSSSLSEAEIHFLQGAAYIEKGAIDEAIKELKVALKLNPNDPRVYNNLGLAYRKKQMVDEALSYYRKALDLDPSYLDARVNLGEIYLQKGMVNEAVSELQQALRLEPNRAEIHNNLGVIFLKRKTPGEAISSFKKALSINPQYGEAYFNLALAYYYTKDIPAASSNAKKALDLGYPVDPKFLKVLRISP